MVAGASELCTGWSPGSVLTSAIDLAMTLCGHPESSHSLGVLSLKREAYSILPALACLWVGGSVGGWVESSLISGICEYWNFAEG